MHYNTVTMQMRQNTFALLKKQTVCFSQSNLTKKRKYKFEGISCT